MKTPEAPKGLPGRCAACPLAGMCSVAASPCRPTVISKRVVTGIEDIITGDGVRRGTFVFHPTNRESVNLIGPLRKSCFVCGENVTNCFHLKAA